MRPFRVLSKLKHLSIIRSESCAINTETGFLARDIPPSVGDYRQSTSKRRMRPYYVLSKLKHLSIIRSESCAINTENGFLARDTPPSAVRR